MQNANSNLSDAKRNLLKLALEGRGGLFTAPSVPIRDLSAPIPLTSQQRPFWIFEKLRLGSPICNLAEAIVLEGVLDTVALATAFELIVERHQAFRMHVDESAVGSPRLILSEGVVGKLEVREPALSRDAAFVLAEEIARTSIPLDRAPLARAVIIPFPGGQVLVMVINHIIGDGWSFAVCMRDLQALYRHQLDGTAPTVDETGADYADYAVHVESDAAIRVERDAALERSTYRLRGIPPLASFPADRQRKALFDIAGSVHYFSLPVELTGALDRATKRLNCSRFDILFSAFCVLLGRYTGQRDVVVGVPEASRDLPGTESMIGAFLKILLVRVDLSEGPSFDQCVERTQSAVRDARQDVGADFAQLATRLGLGNDWSRHPIFQVMFVFQNWRFSNLELPGIHSTRVGLHNGTSKYDLSFVLEERNGQVHGSIEYASALYDDSTITKLVLAYSVLLGHALAHDGEPIDTMPLLPAFIDASQEVDDLQVELPPEFADFAFAARAAENPDVIALEFGGQEITRGKLWRQSCGIAQLLASKKLGPGKRVGILVQRGIPMVAGLYGILASGAAYVPLEPSLPLERLRFIAKDASLAAILHDSASAPLADAIAEEWGLALVNTDDAPNPGRCPKVARSQSDLAYLIYTSGSTGAPKAVMVEHDCLSRYVQASAAKLDISRDTHSLALTRLSFDPHIQDLVVPLCVGGAVTIAAQHELADPAALRRQLERGRVNFVQATPTTFKMLVAAGWTGGPELCLCVGAEPLEQKLAEALLARCGRLINLYGVTECTVWQSATVVQQADMISVENSISPNRLLLLDDGLQPLPDGALGEIYISGPLVAIGYCNRTALTADRFLPDPFSKEPGARVYRTGDLARFASGGRLQLLGRRDFQIKFHGHRIEPGEIESAIVQHPGVREAVVQKRLVNGGEMLAAFVVTDWPVDLQALREALASDLPNFMVPQRILVLESLPRNPNGKVDRGSLFAIPVEPVRTVATLPSNELERELLEIYHRVLDADSVDVEDNFMEIGGSSINAALILEELNRAGHRSVQLIDLFEYPTIRSLAAALVATDAGENLVSREPGSMSAAERRDARRKRQR